MQAPPQSLGYSTLRVRVPRLQEGGGTEAEAVGDAEAGEEEEVEEEEEGVVFETHAQAYELGMCAGCSFCFAV